MRSTDVPVHLIVTCSIFVPELFLERVVHQLNVLAELIVFLSVFFAQHSRYFPVIDKDDEPLYTTSLVST